MDRFRLTTNPLALLLMLTAASAALGQVSSQDHAQVQDAPISSRQDVINQLLLDYAAKQAQAARQTYPRLTEDLRRAAFEDFHKAMAQRQELIKDYYDNDQRPLWQTDLAQQQLIDDLQLNHDNANDFYEFGIPSIQQRDVFEMLVPQALAELSDADLRLSQEESDLPKQPDHVAKRVNTGLWERMNQYFNLRVPYYLAHAAYYAALLPDSASCYHNLGNAAIANQPPTPAQERAHLLALAIAKLDPIIKAPEDPYQVRRPAICLTARALIAGGNFDQAVALLDPLTKDGADDRTNLLARLAKAQALESNSNPASLEVLADTRHLPWIKQNLLFNLLVADATHRILLRRAQNAPANDRAAAVALAYQPYRELLDDPDLGAKAGPLQDFIARRWESSISPGQDMSNLPGMMVAALGQVARSRGQNLMDQAATQKDASEASRLRAQGKENLDRAVSLNAELLRRKDLTSSVKAQAMFNEAVAIYYLNPRESNRVIRCSRILTDLADQMPDQKLSEPAITNAVGLLHYLLGASPRSPDVLTDYRRAVEVLMAKYPATKAAMDERLYYAAEVLAPEGELTRAVEILRIIPAGHPDYFPARCALLDCLERQYQQAKTAAQASDDVGALAAALEAEANRIGGESQTAQAGAMGEDAAALRRAAGWSRLVLAEMAMERRQDPGQTLAILQNFERDHANDPELIRRMLEKRIPALFKVDRIDDAYRDALRLMDTFPDNAPPVIDGLPRDTDQYMESLRLNTAQTSEAAPKSGLSDRAKALVGQELRMSRFMLDWGAKQRLTNDRMLPYQLLYAKSLRLSDRPREALDVLVPLLSANPDNAEVIFAAGEAWFAQAGDKNLLEKASPLYDRLISGIPAKNGIYPVMWWTAWVRRLQICDITKQGADQISLRIRQLRIKDANLGGDSTRPILEMLEKKYGQ